MIDTGSGGVTQSDRKRRMYIVAGSVTASVSGADAEEIAVV
jgi:hypothetical protein